MMIADGLTRKQCIAELRRAGYTGPTSYLLPKLRQLVSDCTSALNTEEIKAADQSTETLGLPAKSLAFFRDLAEDAGNWSGNPWLNGNVAAGKSSSGMSQTLVRHGLITIGNDCGDAYAVFTPKGIEAAAKLGIDLSWIK